jgi:hypothetical protein
MRTAGSCLYMVLAAMAHLLLTYVIKNTPFAG